MTTEETPGVAPVPVKTRRRKPAVTPAAPPAPVEAEDQPGHSILRLQLMHSAVLGDVRSEMKTIEEAVFAHQERYLELQTIEAGLSASAAVMSGEGAATSYIEQNKEQLVPEAFKLGTPADDLQRQIQANREAEGLERDANDPAYTR